MSAPACSTDARVWVLQNQMPENEGLKIEFKKYSWKSRRVRATTKMVRKSGLESFRATTKTVICAFLNSEGGSLFFGVDDKGKIVGTRLTQEQYDQFLQHINHDFHHMFHPTLDISIYAIQRHQVLNSKGFAITDTFVIEIKAIKPQSDETYFVKAGQNWTPFYRRDATVQKMLPGQIKRRLRPARPPVQPPIPRQQDDVDHNPHENLLYDHVEQVTVLWHRMFGILILLLIIFFGCLVFFIFKSRIPFCSFLCPEPEPSIFWRFLSLFE